MVCPHCDRRIPDGSEKCEYCGLEIVTEEPQEQPKEKKPSVLLGTLGGLLGAVLGGGLVFFASQIGGLAGTIAGMLLAFLTLKGCQLLGRRLTRGGIMISMALIVVVTYIADRLDWACRVMTWQAEQVLDTGVAQMDVFGAFMLVPSLINTGNIELPTYLTNLGIMYVFCGVGAFLTIRNILRNQD